MNSSQLEAYVLELQKNIQMISVSIELLEQSLLQHQDDICEADVEGIVEISMKDGEKCCDAVRRIITEYKRTLLNFEGRVSVARSNFIDYSKIV